MRHSPYLVVAVVLVVVLVFAGSVFAYDSSRSDAIASGVKVGAVDVGGLSAAAARAKLRASMLDKLNRTLVVVAGETRLGLSAREARIQADIDAMVTPRCGAAATARSSRARGAVSPAPRSTRAWRRASRTRGRRSSGLSTGSACR